MEVIITVGLPASGKSTYAKQNFPNYTIISLDQLHHDRRKEQELIEEELKKGNSIVIDDTNATEKIRAEHIKLAKKYDARIIALHLDYPIPYVIHQNEKREKPLPKAAIFKVNKELDAPAYYEGFDEIITKKLA